MTEKLIKKINQIREVGDIKDCSDLDRAVFDNLPKGEAIDWLLSGLTISQLIDKATS